MNVTRNDATSSPARVYFDEAANSALGDPTTQLAVMVLEHAKDSRDLNQEQNRLEEEHLRHMQRQQVDFMRKQAKHVRNAGRIKGAAMMVGGVATIAAGVAEARGQVEVEARWKAAGGGANGFGEWGAANAEKAGNDAATNATEHKHKGGESERRLEDLREQRSHLRQLQSTALEHLESIEKSKAETDRTLATWRA
jgi:fatty acid-binding protein DegV